MCGRAHLQKHFHHFVPQPLLARWVCRLLLQQHTINRLIITVHPVAYEGKDHSEQQRPLSLYDICWRHSQYTPSRINPQICASFVSRNMQKRVTNLGDCLCAALPLRSQADTLIRLRPGNYPTFRSFFLLQEAVRRIARHAPCFTFCLTSTADFYYLEACNFADNAII